MGKPPGSIASMGKYQSRFLSYSSMAIKVATPHTPPSA